MLQLPPLPGASSGHPLLAPIPSTIPATTPIPPASILPKPSYMDGKKAQSMSPAVGEADPSILNPLALAGELVELNEKMKAAKEEFEKAEALVKEKKATLMLAFDAHKTDKVSTGGKTIYRWSQWRASITEENRLEAFEALRAAKLGDLIKETVNAQSLSAWVREQPKAADDTPILPNVGLQKCVTMHKTNDLRIINS